MSEMRLWFTLARHGALLWRTGLLRFRLETFGLYYPALPYQTPAWHLSPRRTLLLVRRARSYGLWLLEMEEVRRSGGRGWWRARDVSWEEPPHE